MVKNPGYPWRGERPFSRSDLDDIARRVTQKIRVDPESMEMREGLGGVFLRAKPQSSTPSNLQWFRILTDDEVYTYTSISSDPVETENQLRCRDAMGCPGGRDNAPSIWAARFTTEADTCLRPEENPPVLLYFPKLWAYCSDEEPEPKDCEFNKYIGLKMLGFFNTEADRWETDNQYIGNPDQVDFVYFCNPTTPVVPCNGPGSCDEEDQSADTCCIFDGRAIRDYESCSYECEWNNRSFDVWILAGNTGALPLGQTCFLARRISDSHEITYCPFGDTGPSITERRPVYALGSCECNCPKDEVYLEFYAIVSGVEGPEEYDCDINGQRITVPVTEIAPLGDGTRVYEGYFCRTYTVPRFVVQAEHPSDPHPVYFECDCLTGECGSQVWIDSGDAGVAGGGCYLPASIPYNATCADSTFQYDVLKRYVSGGSGPGDPQICEDLYTTCRFCYKLTIQCTTLGVISAYIQLAVPPGNPAHGGSPTDPLVNLTPLGSQQPLQPLPTNCEGRQWFNLDDPVFGRVNLLTAQDDLGNPLIADPEGLCGFPAIMQHVFGGCCWDHRWVGTQAVQPGGVYNYCTCCFEGNEVAILSCQNGAGCNLSFYVKMGWNCSSGELLGG